MCGRSVESWEEEGKESESFVQKSIHSRVFVGSSSSDVIDAAVVCGDLNCIAGSAEYEKIMEVLGGEKQTFRDTLPIGDDDDESLQTFPECTYSLKKGRYVVVDETTKKKRLDYIFEISEEGEVKMSRRRKTKARVVRALRDDNNVPLSDHRGIIAAIERVYN